MTQKIEWYKEVLDIEPTSRIFFPLAKLYAASGRYKEALETLRLGLSNHPDLLEARLFLVEVLVAMDMEEATGAILNEIGAMFSRYPAFWNAWSQFMAQDPKLKDAAMALRLFAAALSGKTISWNTIMERGIAASLATAETGGDTENFSQAREGDKALTAQKNLVTDEQPSQPEVRHAPLKATALNAVCASVSTQDNRSVKKAEPEAQHNVAHAEQATPEALQSEVSTQAALQAVHVEQAVPHAKNAPLDVLQTGQEALHNTQSIVAASEQDTASDSVQATARDSEQDAAEQAVSDSISVASRQPVAMEDLPVFEDTPFVPPVPSVVFDDEDVQEEPFSLRTRTMADILAEQGDIAGALDIYNELMRNAGKEDRAFLQQRIEDLSVKGGSHDQPLPGEDSERLAALLMSLAQRLDIRATK